MPSIKNTMKHEVESGRGPVWPVGPVGFAWPKKGRSMKTSRKMLVAAFVCSVLALTVMPARAGNSAPFRLDTRSGMRIAGEVESLAYSTEWNHGGSVQVAVDGVILKDAEAPASGEVLWNAAEAGNGIHTLTHTSGGETLTASFAVGKPAATVTLGGLEQVYDGTPKMVDVATEPEGLAVVVTYDGSGEAPTGAGSYAVRAVVADDLWLGVAEGVLEIAKASQTIAFAEIGTQAVTNMVVLGATASSGLEVSYAVEGPAVVAGNVLTFTGEGTVRVTASQAGNGNWEAAEEVMRGFEVRNAPGPGGWSAPFPLDTRSGMRLAGEVEFISYSTEWNHGESVRVEADGTVLEEAVAPASGAMAWNAGEAGVGLHTLTHTSGGETLTAVFLVVNGGGGKTYQWVAFDANGGTCSKEATMCLIGGTYSGFASASWENHKFLGWFDAREGGNRVKVGMEVTSDFSRTLYAHWADQQTVRFDPNGGTCPKGSGVYRWDETYSGFKIPVRGDHKFLGWFDAREGGTRVQIGMPVTEEYERTLYAHWGQTVHFDANGGTCKKTSMSCVVGETYVSLASASRGDNKFLGWFDARKGGNRVRIGMEVTAEAKRTLYAHWGQTVHFDANGGTCKKTSMSCVVGETYVSLASVSRGGIKFLGWFDARKGGNRVRIGMEVTDLAERTLYAHWGQTVHFDANGGTCKKTLMSCVVGETYTSLASASWENRTFLGWYDAREGGNRVRIGMEVPAEAERTLYAQWGGARQTVYFDANGGRCPTASVNCFIGEMYSGFKIPTWDGHSFLGWYDAREGGSRVRNGMTVTEVSERTLFAHWKAGAASLSISGFSMIPRTVGSTVRGTRTASVECTLWLETVAGSVYEILWTPSLDGEWMILMRWVADEDGETSVTVDVPADSSSGFFCLGLADEE